ncbi:hypothetical protein ACTWP5_21710 [Streptomyces sp. 4N509B]|uniref:hypothetical protein n=1 Tax=Streptomyces sp. 4N509B TaxID=3457413 RepID=UPI003FCFFA94
MTVGPVAGDRLPTPPRERKPALAALAALLVLLGALGATMLVLRAGDRIEAIMITERVPAGQPIPEEAITSVMVADNTDVAYVEWSQRGQLDRYRAETDLVPGAVLVGPMLTEEASLDEGQAIVGVTLEPGQYPPGLEAGDTIAAYLVGDGATETDEETETTPNPLLVERAKITEIHGEEEPDGSTAVSVRMRVGTAVVPALTQAASDGNVSVVIVGSSNSN